GVLPGPRAVAPRGAGARDGAGRPALPAGQGARAVPFGRCRRPARRPQRVAHPAARQPAVAGGAARAVAAGARRMTTRPATGHSTGPARHAEDQVGQQVEQAIEGRAVTAWGDLPPQVVERRDEAATVDCGWG